MRRQDSHDESTLIPESHDIAENVTSSDQQWVKQLQGTERRSPIQDSLYDGHTPLSESPEHDKHEISPPSARQQQRRHLYDEPRPISGFIEPSEREILRRSDQQPRKPKRVSIDLFDSQGVQRLARSLTSSTGSETLVDEEYDEVDRETFGEPSDYTKKALRNFLHQWESSGNKANRLGVVFEDLHVVGAGAFWGFQPTLASTLNPLSIIKAVHSFFRPPLHDIISNFEGLIRPGEMLLVLGRPKSGCSTLLRVLANMRHQYHSVEGNIYYDTLTSKEVAKHYRGDVQYFPNQDHHWPTLTVYQTIHFAAMTRALAPSIWGMKRSQYIRVLTDIYTAMFGLAHLRDTRVGGLGVQGINNSERMRLSICEMLANRCRVSCWDNSTTGLDGSASLAFAQALRMATDLAGISTVASFYQIGEQTYDLFDKVCLVYDGRMVYYGRADQARQYFIDMGYVPMDSQQTTPDFLVSNTDPVMRKFGHGKATGPIPRTAKELEAHYRASATRIDNVKELEGYKRVNVDIADKLPHTTKHNQWLVRFSHHFIKGPYTIPILMQAKLVLLRQLQLTKASLIYRALMSFACAVEGCILGANFDRMPNTTSSYFSRAGIVFLSLMIPTLVVVEEVSNVEKYHQIVLRHVRAAMHRHMLEAFAWTLFDVVFTFIDVMMFTIPVYFIADLLHGADQFFIYFLFLFTMVICLRAGVRAVAIACDNPDVAREHARNAVLLLSLYTGYEIQTPGMIGALRWITYINPYRYAFAAMLTSQLHNSNFLCSSFIPSGPGYEDIPSSNQVCSIPGSVAGQQTVDGEVYSQLIFDFSVINTWQNFAILCIFTAFFFLCFVIISGIRTDVPAKAFPVLFKRSSRAPIVDQNIVGFQDVEKLKDPRCPVDTEHHDEDLNYNVSTLTRHHPRMFAFSWRHITYVVDPGISERRCQLLNDVSGYVAPGHLSAFLGGPGTGMTTLLRILAGRMGTGVITGDRFLGGHPLPSDFECQVGYCQEKEVHVTMETVREALKFSARLRQPKSVSMADKDAYADKCLQICGLEGIADAMLGSLQVEQLKRISIAIEVAAKPPLLLFVDNPTFGLDSSGARAVMLFLRKLADAGLSILCTIDKPSTEVLQAFDRVLVLGEGGESVYFGKLGRNSATLVQYFELNGSRRCSPDENPAEFVLDVVKHRTPPDSDADWGQIWMNSQEFERLESRIERIHAEGRTHPPVAPVLQSRFAASWLEQVVHLVQRQMRYTWRNPFYLIAKLYFNVMAGLVIGFTFSRGLHSIRGTRDKVFAVFAATFISFPLGSQLIPTYIKMRDVYEGRENLNRVYHWTAFTTSCLLSEIPWNFLGSTLFFFPWYWIIGFPTSSWGLAYVQFGYLFPLYYTTLALAAASVTPDIHIGEIVYASLYTVILSFDDVVQPFYDFGWMIWFYYVTPFTYLTDAAVAQLVSHQPITCGDNEFVLLEPPSGSTCSTYLAEFIARVGSYVTNPEATSACRVCPYSSTNNFLYRNYHVWYGIRWRYTAIFIAFIFFNTCVFYLFAYLRMRYNARSRASKKRSFTLFKKLKRIPHV